jgi:ELWxxDGT repeat protein
LRIRVSLCAAISAALVGGLAPMVPGEASASSPLPPATLVADILPGGRGSEPRELTALGGVLYFTAMTAGHGRELWRSDGTSDGTRLVADVVAGPQGSAPRELTAVNDRLMFTAWHPTHGRELWSSDGTSEGTRLVADVAPGTRSSAPRELTYGVHPNGSGPTTLAFFSADDGVHGREIWRTNGTPAGTVLVKDIKPGPDGSDPAGFAVPPNDPRSGNVVVFAADDGTHGREVWRGWGTGAQLEADIRPGAQGSDPTSLYGSAINLGRLGTLPLAYLSADDGVHGREPVVSILGHRTSVIDVRPGADGSAPQGFTMFAHGFGAFSADDGVRGREPYYVRPAIPGPGSQDSVELIADLNPGPAGSQPQAPAYQPTVGTAGTQTPLLSLSRGYLSATGADGRARLHTIDVQTYRPSPQSAEPQVRAMTPGVILAGGERPESSVLVRGVLAYSAVDAARGREIFISGGHASNTGMLTDIRRGPRGSDPRWLTTVGDRVFFSADDGSHGRELWSAVLTPAALVGMEYATNSPPSTEPTTYTLRVVGTGSSTPTGTVTVWDGANAVAVQSLSGGTATWTTTLSPGEHRIVVTYSGDHANGPATSDPVVLFVR